MNQQDESNAIDLLYQVFGHDLVITERQDMDVEWAPVERWFINSPIRHVPTSVVIKTRRHSEVGWGGHTMNLVAERRALACLNNSPHSPYLYAYDDDQGVIVMEDIREAVTVEKLLFGNDETVAIYALIAMAQALGSINGMTAGMPEEVWNPAVPTLDDPASSWDIVHQLLDVHDFGTIDVPRAEIREVERLVRTAFMRSLTHWDANPCIALIDGERVVLIDFEAASPRHMAIDGASFALSFSHYRYWSPIDDEIINDMRDAWVDGVIAAWSDAPHRSLIFRHLAAATVCKTFERLTRLGRIADPDQPHATALRRRSQIADTIQRTIRSCEQADAFPALVLGLREIETEMRERWPEIHEVPKFPAFNAGKREGWIINHPV